LCGFSASGYYYRTAMMDPVEDTELLRRYAEERSEAAFAEIVRRRINFVYSCALRRVGGDAHLAQDVAQQVFCALARDARALARRTVLGGWLYTTTRFVAAQTVRTERRRHAREQEAGTMNEITGDPTPPPDWEKLRPVLDDTIDELDETDREAVVLRFFEGRTFADIGARLRLTENAARMRVERALDKLHGLLARRGVNSTGAALAAALAHQTLVAAPAGLAATITGMALSHGTAIVGVTTGGSVLGNFMSMTKLQVGVSSALAIAGATGYVTQANTNAQLQGEMAALRQQNSAITTLQTENERLARVAAEVAGMRGDDVEFARLQTEAAGLRTRLQQVARVEEARAKTATSTAPIDITRLDQAPAPRFQPRPEYPAELRSLGTRGDVVVDFVVDPNGDVQNAFAARSSQREFEAAAVEAVSKWKFKAGRKGGRNVATHMQVPIVFTVEGAGAPGGMTVKETDLPDNAFRVVATPTKSDTPPAAPRP
jgi:RNA polymerase sigma factor (sigma-70 family)